MNPLSTIVPRTELIADEVFVRRESEGEYPADRLETVLSAIYYCVFWSAVFHGMKPDVVEKYINEAEITKPKKWHEPTQAERQKIAEMEQKKHFESIRHKFKDGQ